MMQEYKDYKRGDVVEFTDHYYTDPSLFVPQFRPYDWYKSVSQDDLSRALYRVRAVVTDFWSEGVFIKYELFGQEIISNHFWFEIEPTGERRIPNDPTRYDKALL